MNVFKSIQWRLQIWYGVVLVAVLASLGATAYRLQRDLQVSRIDDELQRRFSFVGGPFRPGREAPGPDNDDFAPPGEGPPERALRAAALSQFFGNNAPDQFFYVVRSPDGRELARTTNAPNAQFIDRVHGVFAEGGGEPHKPPTPQTVAGFRLVAVRSPFGESVVGCPWAPVWRELRVTAWKLTGASAVILFLGLAGGWWISRRAIAPIASISATAATIAAGNLAQRINVTDTESELGQLACVLNSTFARLESSFAQQQQFTSDVAHELRTPVSVMLTQTQTALQRERDASEYRQCLEACQRAAQRMRRLVAALLELARLDAGQEVFRSAPLDFAKTVSDCVELVRPLACERAIKIQTQIAPVVLKGDAERLSRVVTNLLTNAIEYNRPCGEVRVNLEADDGLAVLVVSDSGVGISAADLPHVFERFYRADASRSGDSGHAGLGLAICQSIIDTHGGTIEASSTPAAGTTFTVRLPLNRC